MVKKIPKVIREQINNILRQMEQNNRHNELVTLVAAQRLYYLTNLDFTVLKND
jgi:hypothetical protein